MSNNAFTYEQLVAFASGELSEREAASIESWLAALPDEARDVARLRSVLNDLRAESAVEPPAQAVRAALAAVANRHDTPLGWIRSARRILADVVLDTRRQIAVAGFRGSGSGHLLAYRGESARLDLQARPIGDRWLLRGQVALERDVELGSVAVLDPRETVVAHLDPDDSGCFSVELATGAYEVLVELDCGRQALVAPDVKLGVKLGN